MFPRLLTPTTLDSFTPLDLVGLTPPSNYDNTTECVGLTFTRPDLGEKVSFIIVSVYLSIDGS